MRKISHLLGFILTKTVFDKHNQLCIDLWVTTDHGPVTIKITTQKAIFFIKNTDITPVKNILANNRNHAYNIKPIALKTFSSEKVSAVYFNSNQSFKRAVDILKSHHIDLYETDIDHADRYLMERFITGSIAIHGENIDGVFYNPRIVPAEYNPSFRTLIIHTKTQQHKKHSLLSISSLGFNQNKDNILMREFVLGIKENKPEQCYYPNIKSLLTDFIKWFENYNPDILIGWNILKNSIEPLQYHCQKNNIHFNLNRNPNESRQFSKVSDQRKIQGRLLLDSIDLLKNTNYNLENYELENTARKLLNDKNNGNFLEKSLDSCELIYKILKKTQMLKFIMDRARLTGLTIGQLGNSLKAFDYLYLPKLHRKGFIAPVLTNSNNYQTSPGGYVFNSKPGIYRNIIVLDFKSLYPSIIRTFKIDPLGLIIGLKEHKEKNSIVIPGYLNSFFSLESHILPNIITTLWQARDKAKLDNDKTLAYALKILMNSFYGILGTRLCRFFDPRLASSITKRGHYIIKESKILIEKNGYEVIYGDTDSLFIALQSNLENNEIDEIGKHLIDKLNDYWHKKLANEFHIDSYLEVEFEKHYKHFIMPTIRGSQQGSKKRYAGIIINKQGKQELQFTGLEAVRSDWTHLAKDFQYELYYRILLKQPYDNFIKSTVKELLSGYLDSKLVYRKKLNKTPYSYKKNAPPHVKAAIKAMENIPGDERNYTTGTWIEYIMTINGPEVITDRSSPIDYEHYISKQLTPIADNILSFFSRSFNDVINPGLNI